MHDLVFYHAVCVRVCVCVCVCAHLVRLVVEHHEVSITDIEAREMLTGILGIKDVLIDNKRCTSCVGCTSPVRNNESSC